MAMEREHYEVYYSKSPKKKDNFNMYLIYEYKIWFSKKF